MLRGSTLQFSLTEEQAMLQALVERFAADRGALTLRAAYRAAPHGFSLENWAQLSALGVLAAPFDTEQGGLGSTADATLVLMETAGRGLVSEPLLERLILPGRILEQAHDQRRLAGLLAGTEHIAVAHFEQSVDSSPERITTRSRRTANGDVIDGEKTLVPGGSGADTFIVSAHPNDRRDALRLFLVRCDSPGVTVRPFRLADGSQACTLTLRGAPAAPLECSVDGLMHALDEARIAAGAEMLGIMSKLFEATLEHVRNRKQFGVPLGTFQVVQHGLADLYVRIEQSRSQLYRAALSEPAQRAVAVAAMKSYVSSAAIELGEQCIHWHGGMGMADEVAIGHGHKRLLVLATLLGDADCELQRYAKLASSSLTRSAAS